MHRFNRHQLFVFVTSALAIGASVVTLLFAPNPSLAEPIDLTAVPQMGSPSAPVQMVLFEDLRCGGCRDFHLTVLPQIKKQYIETGKVRCAFVVLAFLENSLPLAQACLAVHEKNPEQFFLYVEEIFASGEENNELERIDAKLLEQAKKDAHLHEIVKANEALGRKLMKSDYATPTVFINGVKITEDTFEAVAREIENFLKDHEKAAV